MPEDEELRGIDVSDMLTSMAEIVAPPRRNRSKIEATGESPAPRHRCNTQTRAFMSRVLRNLEDLDYKEQEKQRKMGLNPRQYPRDINIEVPTGRLVEQLGLKYKDPNDIIEAIASCPESEFIKVDRVLSRIKLTLTGTPETKAVKHYDPRFRQDS